MPGSNLLFALFYRFSDKLYDLGLVNGISRKATRPFPCGAAVVFVVVWLGVLASWTYQAGRTLFQ